MSFIRLSRRTTLGLAGLALPGLARATTLSQTARIVIGVPPGATLDMTARLLAEQMRRTYAPQVLVENRPGASLRLAVEAVKAAPPDGGTILVCPMPVLTLFPHVFPRTTRYDPVRDFVPTATIANVSYAMVVNPRTPANTVTEFLDWAKARGGANFAPPVLGSPQHLIGLEIARRAGVSFTTVSYRGGAPALQDLVGGQIDMVLTLVGDVMPLVRGGQLRLIGLSTPTRLPEFPNAQPFAEAGFTGLPVEDAIVACLPAGTPPAIVEALNAAIGQAVAHPSVTEGLRRIEAVPRVLSPAATAERLRQDLAAWQPIVAASGFNADA